MEETDTQSEIRKLIVKEPEDFWDWKVFAGSVFPVLTFLAGIALGVWVQL